MNKTNLYSTEAGFNNFPHLMPLKLCHLENKTLGDLGLLAI
jgi:hypothetical protein